MALFLIQFASAALALSANSQAVADTGRSPALTRALAGRVAGDPVDCLNLSDIRSSSIIDRTAILFETANGTLYVNRPPSGAEFLESYQSIITDTHTPQLCSVDIVRLRDNGSRIEGPSVGLGEFVPYSKPGSVAR